MQIMKRRIPSFINPDSRSGQAYLKLYDKTQVAIAENKDRIENVTGVAIALGTAYAYGVVRDKLPNEGNIPGTNIGMDLAGGLGLAFTGAVMRSKVSMPLMFAGLGLAIPAIREYGEQATFF